MDKENFSKFTAKFILHNIFREYNGIVRHKGIDIAKILFKEIFGYEF